MINKTCIIELLHRAVNSSQSVQGQKSLSFITEFDEIFHLKLKIKSNIRHLPASDVWLKIETLVGPPENRAFTERFPCKGNFAGPKAPTSTPTGLVSSDYHCVASASRTAAVYKASDPKSSDSLRAASELMSRDGRCSLTAHGYAFYTNHNLKCYQWS